MANAGAATEPPSSDCFLSSGAGSLSSLGARPRSDGGALPLGPAAPASGCAAAKRETDSHDH